MEEFEAPSFIPKLLVAPSCLSRLSETITAITELSKKRVQLLTITYEEEELQYTETLNSNRDGQLVDHQLESEVHVLESKIYALANEASVMRKELVERRYYVVVSSVNEMKIVNELRLGVGIGATTDLQRFRGKVYVPGELPRGVVKAIEAVERSCEIFERPIMS